MPLSTPLLKARGAGTNVCDEITGGGRDLPQRRSPLAVGKRGPLVPVAGVGWKSMLIDKLAIAAISPLGTSLLFAALALVLAWRRRGRWAVRFGGLAFAWLLFWSLPVVSLTLRGALESGYPPVAIDTLPRAPVIVVLGGSVIPPGRDGSSQDLGPAVDRVWHAARLYHSGKAPMVVLSGGSDPAVSAMSEAAAMAGLLQELGVPPSALLREERSRNTRENASYTAALLAEQGAREILLVTSALHMPRARALFEAEGIIVYAAATDHEARTVFGWLDWLPDAGALEGSARGLKELVGRCCG